MKKMNGFIGLISMTLVLVLGAAGTVAVVQHGKASDQLTAQTQAPAPAEIAPAYIAEN